MSCKHMYYDEHINFHHSVDRHPQRVEMHIHEQLEIYCYISGDAVYLVEGTEYPLASGSILIMRPSESHMVKFLSDKTYERYSIHFSPELLKDIDPDYSLLAPFYGHELGQNNLYLPSEFMLEQPVELLKNMCNSEAVWQSRVEILSRLYPMLATINNAYARKQFENATENPAQKIISYINGHLFDELSLSMLSEHFFLSVSQLCRLFKQATGSSVWDYILIKRLIAAKNSIKKGMPATAAAENCGFRDYSSFWRAYTKYFGHSPNKDFSNTK